MVTLLIALIYLLDPETVALSGADYIGQDVPYDLRPVSQQPTAQAQGGQFAGVPLTSSVGFNPNQAPPQSYNPQASYQPQGSYNPAQSYAGPQSYGGQGLVQSGFIQPSYSQGLPSKQGGGFY